MRNLRCVYMSDRKIFKSLLSIRLTVMLWFRYTVPTLRVFVSKCSRMPSREVGPAIRVTAVVGRICRPDVSGAAKEAGRLPSGANWNSHNCNAPPHILTHRHIRAVAAQNVDFGSNSGWMRHGTTRTAADPEPPAGFVRRYDLGQ